MYFFPPNYWYQYFVGCMSFKWVLSGFPIHSLMIYFDQHKFYFGWTSIYLNFKKSLPILNHESFYFSSRHFTLAFTFIRYMSHLIFRYDASKWLRFMFYIRNLIKLGPFSEKPSFPHNIAMDFCFKSSETGHVSLFLGFIFIYSIGLSLHMWLKKYFFK